MHRALASVIFAGLAASASAHPTTTAIIAKPRAAAQLQRTPGIESVKVSVPRNISVAAPNKDIQSAEPGRSPYGMLLATLVVMAAIAVRRQRTGRS